MNQTNDLNKILPFYQPHNSKSILAQENLITGTWTELRKHTQHKKMKFIANNLSSFLYFTTSYLDCKSILKYYSHLYKQKSWSVIFRAFLSIPFIPRASRMSKMKKQIDHFINWNSSTQCCAFPSFPFFLFLPSPSLPPSGCVTINEWATICMTCR